MLRSNRVEDVLKVDTNPEVLNGDDSYDGSRYRIMERIDLQGAGVMVSY
jgi:hypothetical protein